VASFQGSPPTLGSIVSRSCTASRTGFARRLRRSPPAILDPAPDRERFRLYRVGGEGVARRIQLGMGVGLWLVVRGRLVPRRCLRQWTRPCESFTSEPALWSGRFGAAGHHLPTHPKSSQRARSFPILRSVGNLRRRGEVSPPAGNAERGVESWPTRSLGTGRGRRDQPRERLSRRSPILGQLLATADVRERRASMRSTSLGRARQLQRESRDRSAVMSSGLVGQVPVESLLTHPIRGGG